MSRSGCCRTAIAARAPRRDVAGDTNLPRLLTSLARAGRPLAVCHARRGPCELFDRARCRPACLRPVAVQEAPPPAPRPQPQSHVEFGGGRGRRPATRWAHAAWARLRWPGGEELASNLPEQLDEPVHAGWNLQARRRSSRARAGSRHAETPASCVAAPGGGARSPGWTVSIPTSDVPLRWTMRWRIRAIATSCEIAERLDRATARIHTSGSCPEVRSRRDRGCTSSARWCSASTGRAGMRTWARVAVAAIARNHGRTQPRRELVSAGAARAVTEGTAEALFDATTLTLAQTGTTMPEGAAQEGRVVAWRPGDWTRQSSCVHLVSRGAMPRGSLVPRGNWAARRPASRPRRAGAGIGGAAPRPRGRRVRSLSKRTWQVSSQRKGEREVPSVAVQALAIAARSYARGAWRATRPRRLRRVRHDALPGVRCPQSLERWTRTGPHARTGPCAQRDSSSHIPYSASCSGVLSSPRDVSRVGRDEGLARTGARPRRAVLSTAWRGDVGGHRLASGVARRRDTTVTCCATCESSRALRQRRAGSRIALDGLAPAEIDATTFRHLVGRRPGWDVLESHA